jgi:hypothetical protein
MAYLFLCFEVNFLNYMKAIIPKFFHYYTGNDLIRVGRIHDGGYLISKADIDKSDLLISLGISDDWSFERDFIKYKKVPLFAYDYSISKKHFLKNIIISTLKIYKINDLLSWPRNIFHSIKLFFSYLTFFTGNKKHIKKFVALDTKGVNLSICQIFDTLKSSNIFLKIDIEGSEYRILDTLSEYSNSLTGMAIEFHDCDLHLDKIKKFIKNINLNLVHIHANNFGDIATRDKLPLTLELTFSKNSKPLNKTMLPHELDMPNDKLKKEINIEIEK